MCQESVQTAKVMWLVTLPLPQTPLANPRAFLHQTVNSSGITLFIPNFNLGKDFTMARNICMEKLHVSIGMGLPVLSTSRLIINFLMRVPIAQSPLSIVFPQKVEAWELHSLMTYWLLVCVCLCFSYWSLNQHLLHASWVLLPWGRALALPLESL